MIGMDLIRSKRGMITKLQRELGFKSSGSVSQWKRVPAELLPRVESITGIPRHQLRPDICPPPSGTSEAA
jgi:DNA-binding transcriptional regulator YdaS (Cro superfamily)